MSTKSMMKIWAGTLAMAGLMVTGAGVVAARLDAAAASQAVPSMTDASWDVRNGDQKGKLMLKSTELAFESLTDAKHSRNWKFADIRELTKKGRKDMRVKPFKGSTYDFQIGDGKRRDQIYEMISERVIAARQSAPRK